MNRADPQADLRALIRTRRYAMGFTQGDLAARLGWPRMRLHRIESGVKWVRHDEIAVLKAALGIEDG